MSLSAVENVRLDAIALRQERKPKFLLYRELETASRKEWLVHNLLGAGDASAFYGVPGSGKSVLVEDLALHVAAGREWHGRAVNRGAVLFVALERRKLVERRAIAFRERHQIEDIPFAIIGGMYDLRSAEAVKSIVNACRAIEEEFDATPIGLLGALGPHAPFPHPCLHWQYSHPKSFGVLRRLQRQHVQTGPRRIRRQQL
jgi:hypothetical protein